MSDYLKLILKIGLYLFIFLASMIVFSMVGAIFGTMLDMPKPQMMGLTVFMGSIGTIFSIFIFWLHLKNKEKDLISLCNFDPISLKSTLLTIPITIGFSTLSLIYIALVDKYGLIPDFEAYMELAKMIAPTVPGIIAMVIIAPITEEILFRGLILNFLREKINLKYSIIIQALLFGIIHLNIFQGIFAFLGGILFGVIYVWTKSIWSVIIIHFLNNLFAVVLMLLFYEEIMKIPYITAFCIAIGVIIFLPSLWLLYKDNERKPIDKFQ